MVLFDACFLLQYSLQHKSTGTTAISIKIAAKNKASMKEKRFKTKGGWSQYVSKEERERGEKGEGYVLYGKCGDQFPVA